jgi:hypothetical protein
MEDVRQSVLGATWMDGVVVVRENQEMTKLVERQRFFQNDICVGIQKKLQTGPWLKPTEIVVETIIRMVRYINSFCSLSLRHTLLKRLDMHLVNIGPICLPMFDPVIAA